MSTSGVVVPYAPTASHGQLIQHPQSIQYGTVAQLGSVVYVVPYVNESRPPMRARRRT
jgi:hypothetical protein